METIKQLKKETKKLNIDENRRAGKTTRSYFEFKIQTLKEVSNLIDEDIKFQRSKLTNDFEKDKSIKWRIVGMEELKLRIEGIEGN